MSEPRETWNLARSELSRAGRRTMEDKEIHTVVLAFCFIFGPENSPVCSNSVKYALLLPLPFLCSPLLLKPMWPLVANLCLGLHSLALYASHAVAHLHVCLELCVGIKGAASEPSRQFGQLAFQSRRTKKHCLHQTFQQRAVRECTSSWTQHCRTGMWLTHNPTLVRSNSLS